MLAYYHNKSKLNTQFGISYHIAHNQPVGMKIQVNYVNLGTGFSDIRGDGINDNFPGDANFHINNKYIHTNIALTVSPFKSRFVYFESGLYVSYLIDAILEGEILDGNNGVYVPISLNFSEETKDTDLGITVGIGSNLKIFDHLFLGLGIKYNYGFLDVVVDAGIDDGEYQNSFLMCDLGLKLLL